MVHNDPPENPDRLRGFLTPTDRDYLLDRSDVAPGSQTERNIRANVRKRTFNTMLDFSILLERFGDRDVNQTFGEFGDDEQEAQEHLDQGVVDALGFLYYADSNRFLDRTERGITKALRKQGWFADVTVDLDIDKKRSVDDVYEDVKESGDIYADEAALLRQHNRMTFTDQVLGDVQWQAGERSDGKYGIPDDVDDPKTALEFVTLPYTASDHGDDARQAARVAYDALVRFRDDDGIEEQEISHHLTDSVYPLYPLDFEDPADWWSEFIVPTLSRIGANPPWFGE